MWEYYAQPEGLRLPFLYGFTRKEEAELRNHAWQLLLRGESDGALLSEYAEETLDFNLTDAEVDEITEFLVAARRKQQESWDEETWNTPLSRALASLEQHNILARENFACCLDCSSQEILDEFDGSRPWIGAVYYHAGDTATINEHGFGHLAYGVRLPAFFTPQDWAAMSGEEQQKSYEELTTSMVKQVILPILLDHGINVEWSENIVDRLKLTNVTYLARV